MNYNKILFLLLIFSICIHAQQIKAQAVNINGDTVFVNMDAEIKILFPAPPKSFNTVPANSQYRIWNTGNAINLIAGAVSYDPVILLVSEADRNHRFILQFKKDSGNNVVKLYYDYSTIKKLSQHIRQTPYRSVQTQNIAGTNAQDKKAEIAVTDAADNSLIYQALLELGNKDLNAGNFQQATLSFNKAHALAPQETVALQKLEEIKTKLAAKDSIQQLNERKYQALAEEGNINLGKKKYVQAGEAYKRALDFKPNDAYVTNQLQTINSLVSQGNVKKEEPKNKNINNASIVQAEKPVIPKQLTDDDNYKIAVKSADKFFRSANYDSAKAWYNKALGFSKKDWPAHQLNKINKIQSDQVAKENAAKEKLAKEKLAEENATKEKLAATPKVVSEVTPKNDSILTEAEIRRRYNIALTQGRSSYSKNDLENAKAFYEEATNLRPTQQEPKNQLKIINTKLDGLTKENEIEMNYERTINLADSQVNNKLFDSAIVTYKAASAIMPLESYPWKQIKYVQSEIAQLKKKAIEEKQRRYIDALSRADKAVADKKYDDAKSAYTEVLSINPDNDYAKKRLEIVSYQIEKERLNKLAQDSLNAVKEVPVIKSKRKKSS